MNIKNESITDTNTEITQNIPGIKKRIIKKKVIKRKVIKNKLTGNIITINGTLPKIWSTDIPTKFKKAINENTHKIIIVQAPTGYGKTVYINYALASLNKQSNTPLICTSLMPFRVSVKEMNSYLTNLFPDFTFNYSMRGDINASPNDNCSLMTVGFWLEHFLAEYRENGLDGLDGLHAKQQIIMIDEAHDATWQTDFALRMLLWIQRKGIPIKIIITSATLDTNLINLNNIESLILKTENEQPNVDIIYLEEQIILIKQDKTSITCILEIVKILKNIYTTEQSTSDILIILPGQSEIGTLMLLIEKDSTFNDTILRPLHSQLLKEDIEAAINKDIFGKRKIIMATNIVENAITINNVNYVIDSGLRKRNKIDENGVSQLVLEFATQSNLIQSGGRCGRQGIRGKVYLLLTEDTFNDLPMYMKNEVHNNPLYLQIIKLAYNNMPIKEVLSRISHNRIDNDIKFLISHNALEKVTKGTKRNKKTKIVVTELGKLMVQISLSIRASQYLAHFLQNYYGKVNNQVLYTACVIAVWIDIKTSIFYRPSRKQGETLEDFTTKLDELNKIQSAFYKKDCIKTMLNIWFQSWITEENFYEWCKNNGIFDRVLNEMNNEIKHLILLLAKLGFNIGCPSIEECVDILKNTDEIIQVIILSLMEAFNDCSFIYNKYSGDYNMELYGSIDKYSIDRFLKNNGKNYKRVIALNLRRISPNRIIMSNIVELPYESSSSSSSSEESIYEDSSYEDMFNKIYDSSNFIFNSTSNTSSTSSSMSY